MTVYNLELVLNNEVRKFVLLHKSDVLSAVDLLFSFNFFHNVDSCIFANLIYSYKTNPSFSPCP